ncbi:MAG: phosphoribosylformylglycinamidine synthase [Bacteroidetes bacterium]|nr:phosphoribosylformylglycinamidine synthase [Bacteroidota bacterium]
MIVFFRTRGTLYAVSTHQSFQPSDYEKLIWLLGGAKPLSEKEISGFFIGPRKEMVTPWSTNAVEITQNMCIAGIERVEEFFEVSDARAAHDAMLQRIYEKLDQEIFTIRHTPEPIYEIDDLAAYNEKEGLALSSEEIDYLKEVSWKLGRKLTDSEVFGFSQVNSEHCRHKIFNGTFVIDGKEKESTLFQLIKKTAKENPNFLVSAYKDNVAFIQGPRVEQFAPARQDQPDFFEISEFDSVISLKAETHNFPTTVEPFNGAATGSGGEIRDRLAGGKGSLPLAGTAVYMTSYPRLSGGRDWEKKNPERKWLYQTPLEILIKASDGASDFGNKFGQPLICGSLLTFEHFEGSHRLGFDKVIMLAGGIGFGKHKDSQKEKLKAGDKIVMLGGDNYRIGMGGGAVSSVATGEMSNAIELNAIQRSNPEMQKRVMNAIRAMVEANENPIVSIHDHGAGGHLNCFSELLEETGGIIHIDQLPVGDPTLSAKEIISNESQERMGLAIAEKDIPLLKKIAERERAPMYVVGEASGDHKLIFAEAKDGLKPIDLKVENLFGSSPKTIIKDQAQKSTYKPISYQPSDLEKYLHQVLQLEAVACKDWLTNKVDRCVSGKVATQQTCGELQLPLNNVGVMALDFVSHKGVATSIGHAPAAALINASAGSKMAIAKALTNILFAPLTHGLKGVSLSANWMWPSKNEGEDARLYEAVEAVSNFAVRLGMNIPTGKDSLSMAQKYPDGTKVLSPGTVIISAVAEVEDIRQTVSPDLKNSPNSSLIYIDFSSDEKKLGGSSFGQTVNALGENAPTIQDELHFINAFEALQQLIREDLVLAGHDISSGGLITTLLEMCFPTQNRGMDLQLENLGSDLISILFSENPGVVIQAGNEDAVAELLKKNNVHFEIIGKVTNDGFVSVAGYRLSVATYRNSWFNTSYLLDETQRSKNYAVKRKENIFRQPLEYIFPQTFNGKLASLHLNPTRKNKSGIKAAIIREKGVNSDREMAYALYLAGFDVKDVHMTDLISGREDLKEVNMIVFVGGFSNSDVLGAAKGWAGAFLYNPKAKAALDHFYKREDTLSLGVCNGCQLMMELGLLYPEWQEKMHHNDSGRFECQFLTIDIPQNNSVMLSGLAGTRLGVWMAHGEGKFKLPADSSVYSIAATYTYHEYPANPNGSDFSAAALCSKDGRHLAIMPHIERSLFPWNWPHYTRNKKADEVGPWMEAFAHAKNWIQDKLKIT